MEKAKAAVTDFMSKSGHHDTTVHETVAPSVTRETVKPHVHEELNTAIDKEVHKDHYHRTVQPVKDREVLPEQHTANLGAVQHKAFDHRDTEHDKRNLAAGQAAFKDHRAVEETSHSQNANAAVGGEHVHHHIHETIQPVVHKETIQPHVVHTTVPIHEVHHHAATHHESSELPAMTMSEFKQKGGVLGGREERYDAFEGEPKQIGGTLHNMMEGKTSKRDSHHAEDHMHNATAAEREHEHALGGKTAGAGVAGTTGAAGTMHSHENVRGVEESGGALGAKSSTLGSDRTGKGSYATTGAAAGAAGAATTGAAGLEKKTSLMDRLNPMKDSDGDGKKGFMK